MGLFHKQQPTTNKGVLAEEIDQQKEYFDGYFRDELRNHGRWYFDKVIRENGELFQKDLDSVVDQINLDLKDHISKQLDGAIAHVNAVLKEQVTHQLDAQFSEYSKTMQEAQDAALKNMTDGSTELRQQYHELSSLLKDNITEQNAMMHKAFEDHKAQLQTMDDAQGSAIKTLNESVEKVQAQYQQMGEMLGGQVAEQQNRILQMFESNMAAIVEHYVLGALGEQFDIKAQLPSIIKQMEANKAAMMEDMKL